MSGEEEQDFPETISPDDIARLAELHFGERVHKITAPGGADRDSVRIFFEHRRVIASYRHRKTRRDREILVLSKLSSSGAPVPEYLGRQGALLFQTDVGSMRLSSEMERRDVDGQKILAQAAFEGLWAIKLAARDSGLTQDVTSIADTGRWVARFATSPKRLSRRLNIAPPKADWAALSKAFVPVPRHFVKWDARSGNAAVQSDGSVVWFDWEHAGRRHGVEDFAFLIADEFWPLAIEPTLDAFAQSCPGNPDRLLPDVIRFSVLQAADRLALINADRAKRGWMDVDTARRYDRMGTTPELTHRLAEHARDLALKDPLTEPLAEWFPRCAKAIVDAGEPEDQPDQETEE